MGNNVISMRVKNKQYFIYSILLLVSFNVSAEKLCRNGIIEQVKEKSVARKVLSENEIDENILKIAKSNIPDDAKIIGEVHFIEPYKLKNGHERTWSGNQFNKFVKEYRKLNGKLSDWNTAPILYVQYGKYKIVVDGNHHLKAASKSKIEKVPAIEVKLPFRGFRTIDDLDPGPHKW